MEVVSCFNLFVDSDTNLSGKGDDFVVNMASAGLQAGEGQYIRLNLESFNMFKNFYNINANNNKFRLVINGNQSVLFYIPPKNYKTIGDVATAWSTACAAAIVFILGGQSVVSAVLPDPTLQMDDTSDRIISATFTNSVSCTSIIVQCYSNDGDSYAIIGGDRINGSVTNDTTNSINTTVTSGFIYTLYGKYPAQRLTEEHVYLCSDIPNNNIETTALSAGVITTSAHINTTCILGKIPIDWEFINFNTATGREFIMNLPNRTINTLRFYLRDSKGRLIGRSSGNSSSSGGSTQNTLGNLNCSFVIKVEIIQAGLPKKLMTEPPADTFPKKNGVLLNMNYGNKY